MKTAKNLLRKALSAGTVPYIAIVDYRNTPTQGMESSPAQRLMTRRTKTLLPPTSEQDIQQLKKRQLQQSRYYNQHVCDLPSHFNWEVKRGKKA